MKLAEKWTKSFKKKVGSKVVSCPNCRQKIRVPIRKGKTLEIRCQKCATVFQIHFQSPFGEVFKWYPHHGVGGNLKSMMINFKNLPYQAKVAFFIQILMLFFFILILTFVISNAFKKDNSVINFQDDSYLENR